MPSRNTLDEALYFDADYSDAELEGASTEELMEWYEEEFGRHDWEIMFENENAKVLGGEYVVYAFYEDDEPIIAFCEYQ